MNYQVFYCAARLGDIPGNQAIAMPRDEIRLNVFPMLKEDQEFLGLIDKVGTTLQAMYHADRDIYWFEVPRPDLGGSFGKYLSFEVALELLDALDGDFPVEGFEGFEFQSWE